MIGCSHSESLFVLPAPFGSLSSVRAVALLIIEAAWHRSEPCIRPQAVECARRLSEGSLEDSELQPPDPAGPGRGGPLAVATVTPRRRARRPLRAASLSHGRLSYQAKFIRGWEYWVHIGAPSSV